MHFNMQSELGASADFHQISLSRQGLTHCQYCEWISRSHVKITVLLLIIPVTYIPDSRVISLMQVLCSGAVAITLSRSKGTCLLGL